MASKSINIQDTYLAIQNGIIPGKLYSNKFVFPTIESENNLNKKLYWTIIIKLKNKKNNEYINIKKEYLNYPVTQLSKDIIAEITVESYQEGGKIREIVPTIINIGKNIGKKNETNVITQALRDSLGMYNKKIKVQKNINIDDLMPPPMLIKNNGDSKRSSVIEKDITDGIIIQPKLNGVRVMSFLDPKSKDIIMYSRERSKYPSMNNIRKELFSLFNHINTIDFVNSSGEIITINTDIIYLDGEIYKHGLSLLYITGQSRREKDSSDLEYHIFDILPKSNLQLSSIDRQLLLDQIFIGIKLDHIKRVTCHYINSFDEIGLLKDEYVKKGYEGIIVRRNSGIYKFSYNKSRTDDVIKIKAKYTDEFECIGYTQGTKGKDLGAIIWICKTKNDKIFNVTPKLTYQERYRIYKIVSTDDNFNKFLKGLMITVEYDEISSKTGIPLRAKAEAFRTYESGEDPVAKLLA